MRLGRKRVEDLDIEGDAHATVSRDGPQEPVVEASSMAKAVPEAVKPHPRHDDHAHLGGADPRSAGQGLHDLEWADLQRLARVPRVQVQTPFDHTGQGDRFPLTDPFGETFEDIELRT